MHLNVAGQNLEKHLRQLRVRPFVLLLLLDFLIQRQHELFRNKGGPEEPRRKMRRIVQEEYPETEAHVPEGLRQEHAPPSILPAMMLFSSTSAVSWITMSPASSSMPLRSCRSFL